MVKVPTFTFSWGARVVGVMLGVALGQAVAAESYFVAPSGNDANPGTLAEPFGSPTRAQRSVREKAGTVFLRAGTHYLAEPLVFTAQDSGTAAAPVLFRAYENERPRLRRILRRDQQRPVVSGGVKLDRLDWQTGESGVMHARVSENLRTEEIFVNGERQILARYPNFDPTSKYFDGYAADAISKERAGRWADPTGGYFHAMHPSLWGDFTWRNTGKDAAGEVTREGGWQNDRGGAVHRAIRFVENIFEELDAPGASGEWGRSAELLDWHFTPPSAEHCHGCPLILNLVRTRTQR